MTAAAKKKKDQFVQIFIANFMASHAVAETMMNANNVDEPVGEYIVETAFKMAEVAWESVENFKNGK